MFLHCQSCTSQLSQNETKELEKAQNVLQNPIFVIKTSFYSAAVLRCIIPGDKCNYWIMIAVQVLQYQTRNSTELRAAASICMYTQLEYIMLPTVIK